MGKLKGYLVAFMLLVLLAVLPVAAEATVQQPAVNQPELTEEIQYIEAEAFNGEPVALAEVTVSYTYTSAEKAIEKLRKEMIARKEIIDIHFSIGYDESITDEVLDALWEYMLYAAMEHNPKFPAGGDYLAGHFLGAGGSLGGSTDGVNLYLDYTYEISYLTTAQQEQEMDTAVTTLLQNVAWGVMPDRERIQKLYDYMAANVVYNTEDVAAGGDITMYSAYGALIEKSATHQGYATLLYRLMLASGQDCRVIVGTADNDLTTAPHTWNMVEVDEYYYYVDSASDAILSQAGQPYEYFLKTAASMPDHTPEEVYTSAEFLAAYPQAPEDYPEGVVILGTCGDDLRFTFYSDGIFKIEGTGAMYDYASDYQVPWEVVRTQILQVDMPEGVTAIGKNAFVYCKNLAQFRLPTTVTKIGNHAFYSCSSLKELEFHRDLRQIGDHSFQKSGLETVVLPENIQVGSSAFAECAALSRVELPDTLTSIPSYLFSRCQKLTQIDLPETVTAIGTGAFQYTGITTIRLPDGISEIAASTFYASKLETIQLPGSVKSIGASAFGKTQLKTFIVPNAVIRIGKEAFSRCDQLTEVVLSDALTMLDQGAFQHCISLKKVTLPSNQPTTLGIQIFDGCTGLQEVTIPQGWKQVPNSMFSGCSQLEKVQLPEGLESIQFGAFAKCPMLQQLTIPANVTEIAGRAFLDNTYQTKILRFTGPAPAFDSEAFYYNTGIVLYPAEQEGWTEDVLQQYKGTVTWLAYYENREAPVQLWQDTEFQASFDSVAGAAAYMSGMENARLRLTADVQEETTVTGDLWIDLNGNDLSGITVTGTVYGMDSATNGYCADGAGKLTLAAGTVAPQVRMTAAQLGSSYRYLAVPEAGSWGFHRFYFGVTHITLQPSDGGIGYKAAFAGDRAVKEYLAPEGGFGMMLSLTGQFSDGEACVAAFPAEAFPEEGKAQARSLLLTGILKSDLSDTELAERATVTISACGFLKTKDGQKILSTVEENTLKSMVEQVDKNYNSYTAYQKSILSRFYTTYENLLSQWDLPNMKKQ